MADADLDATLACFDDDISFQDIALDLDINGIAQVAPLFAENYETANLSVRVENIVVENERFAVEWLTAGEHSEEIFGLPATNKSIAFRGTTVGEIVQGKITRTTDYWNLQTLKNQIADD